MHAPEELTQAQRKELLADLTVLDIELREGLRASIASAKPVTLDQQAVGRVSRIDAIQHQQMAMAARQRAETRLALVRQALKIAHSEDYGLCRRCEEPIGFRRLKARPESPICLDCQAAMERR